MNQVMVFLMGATFLFVSVMFAIGLVAEYRRGIATSTEDALWLCAIYALLFFLAGLFFDSADAQTIDQPQIEQLIVSSANHHGIEPELALAIADVESHMNPSMVGGLGEIGLFQLRPEFHYVVRNDVPQNIEVAMKYLVKLKRQCAQYGNAFFVCYNYGPSRKLKRPYEFPYYKKVSVARNARKQKTLIARTED